MRKKGFTLIELLVVIAIIAILAAILFPVFAKAREKARQSSCASNVKQLALSILSYKQDFDETYPLSWPVTAPQGTPGTRSNSCGTYNYWWMDLLAPYVKNEQVFHCPSGERSQCLVAVANSYAPSQEMSMGVKDSAVTVPANTFMIADCAANASIYPHDTKGGIAYRHSEKFNGAYFDGHVKAASMWPATKASTAQGGWDVVDPRWSIADDGQP
jgi:prepilin-type N-terminal cleavage/methylation domain-containing protein/prepilin-type processing-associated H-X9-DG protein